MRRVFLVGLCLLLAQSSFGEVENLADVQDWFTDVQQAWGETGINTCAHAPGAQPLPLQIGEKKYKTGIGHHASGFIEIALDGEYTRFDAEIGLQPLPGGNGSVVFQ